MRVTCKGEFTRGQSLTGVSPHLTAADQDRHQCYGVEQQVGERPDQV